MPMYSSQMRRKKQARKLEVTHLRKSFTVSLWDYHMAKTTSTLQQKVDNEKCENFQRISLYNNLKFFLQLKSLSLHGQFQQRE